MDTKIIQIEGTEMGEWKDFKDLRKVALAFARENFEGMDVLNKDTGFLIRINKNGLKHSISGPRKIPELLAIAAIPAILEACVKSGEEPDKHGRPNVLRIIKFKAELTIGGARHSAAIVTYETGGGILFYDQGCTPQE